MNIQELSKHAQAWLIIGCIGILLYFLVQTVNFYYSEGNACVQNPYIYAAKHSEKNIECSCTVKGRPGLEVYFNGSAMMLKRQEQTAYQYPVMNWSNIKFNE